MPALLLLLLSVLTLAATSDWSQFRGPNGSGVYEGRPLPDQLTPDAPGGWAVAVPFGRSSPIIHSDRIYLTGSEDDRLITVALDRARGSALWKHEMRRTRIDERARGENDPASPTPAADAQGVYVFFPDFGLVALYYAGRERWAAPLGPFHTVYGMASSPIVVDGLVIIRVRSAAERLVPPRGGRGHRPRTLADASARRPRGMWDTPAVQREPKAPPILVVPGSERIRGHRCDDRPASLDVRWLGSREPGRPARRWPPRGRSMSAVYPEVGRRGRPLWPTTMPTATGASRATPRPVVRRGSEGSVMPTSIATTRSSRRSGSA